MKKIGWIGTGVMGHAMVQHIMQAGYEVHVWNRTKSKTDDLVVKWAIFCKHIGELTEKSDIIFSIIWDPKNVEETYFWENMILEKASKWKILVDMTTTKPSIAKKIFLEAQKKWVFTLDAPVSWGDVGAQNGTLSIMVWGEEHIFQKILPLFELMWKSIVYCGEAGMWQHTKMANQISIAWNTIALCESLLYSEKVWLDMEKTIQIISSWAAGSWGWNNLAPRIVRWELDTCFFIKHFLKDLRIVLDECRAMNIYLPGLSLVEWLYTIAYNKGKQNLWTQALIEVLREINSSQS